MSDAIRVGLVGFGYASKTFHAPLIGGTPGMALKAVASSDADKVHADWPGVKVMSAPGICWTTRISIWWSSPPPNDTHFPLAKAALEAGKHVVVDKPFTVTLSQARELESPAKHCGRILSVFHNRRWDSDFLTVSALINEGQLGRCVTSSRISIASDHRCASAGVSRQVLAAAYGMTSRRICSTRSWCCLACR